MITYYNQTTGEMDTFTANNLSTVEVEDVNVSVSLLFTNLRLGTEYQFTIVAYTDVGPGTEAMIIVSTLPDGNQISMHSLYFVICITVLSIFGIIVVLD